MTIRRLLCFLWLVSMTTSEVSRRCYECQDMPKPSDCKLITLCVPGQECVLEQFITSGGLVLYSSGCQSKERCNAQKRRSVPRYSSLSKRDDIMTCDECCDMDFCNDEGCGFTAPRQPQRPPICFTCPSENDPKSCRHLKLCDVGEECMLTELQPDSLNEPTMYMSKCVSRKVCSGYALIGKRKRNTYCHVCCHDDYCNDRCEEFVTPAPTLHTTPIPITSTTPPTKVSTPTIKITTISTPTPKTTTTLTTPTPKTTTTHWTTRSTTSATSQSTIIAAHQTTTKIKCHHANYTYLHHSDLCFKIHYEQKTWDSANEVCKSEGGTLAIIDTDDKWHQLTHELNDDKTMHNVFIGGRHTNESQNADFHWPNGAEVTYTHWGHNEPSPRGGDCIMLYAHDSYKWHDTSCGSTRPFVCSIDV